MASNQYQVKLGRALVNPSKDVRDETVAVVGKFLSSEPNFSEKDMLKLWKALYFCLWLSDKPPIQLELAKSLSQFQRSFAKVKHWLLFVRIFYRTILREWGKLDQYRINKFYSLIRFMIEDSFEVLKKKSYDSEVIEKYCEVLQSEILTKKPNGPRLHILDVYLNEIYNVTRGYISPSQLLKFLDPFLVALGSTQDEIYLERVIKRIFKPLVSSPPIMSSTDIPIQFSNNHLLILQHHIFEIASSEGTRQNNRQKVYQLHSEYQKFTKVENVDLSQIDVNGNIIENLEDVSSSDRSNNISPGDEKEAVLIVAKKSKHNKKRKDRPETEDLRSEQTDKKEPSELHADDIIRVTPDPVEQVVSVVDPDVGGAGTLLKRKKKKAMKSESPLQTASNVLPADHLTGMNPEEVDADSAVAPELAPEYMPSVKYIGHKLGYVFQRVSETKKRCNGPRPGCLPP